MNQQPIRILHVIGIMNRGGAEVMIMNLYRNIDREKIQFDFVEHGDEPACFDEEIIALGGRIFRCPTFNAKNYFAYKKWWNDFFRERQKEFKAVHGHIGRSASAYLNVAKEYGLYTIAHSHNTAKKGINSFLIKAYAYPTRRIADYFLGCAVKAGISRYGKKIVNNPQKFHVLNNAIDTNRFRYDPLIREETRKDWTIDEKIVIGHVGRFFTQKNHEFLIDIFEKIHEINDNTVLFLLGDGELRNQIEKKVERLGLKESVVFAGVQEKMYQFYQAMDVFILPSFFEGLALVTVEAQTSGLKCFISDTISKECIITKNQVTICSLSDEAEEWANKILEQIPYQRSDSSQQVKAHGFDISETVNWVTDFYMGI